MCDYCGCRLIPTHRRASLLRHHTDKEERGIFAELRATGEADPRLDLFPYAMYELDHAQWDTVADVHRTSSATARAGTSRT